MNLFYVIESRLRLYPANTRRWTNADLMLAHRLRRWPNIKSALVQRLMFAGYHWKLLEYRIKKQIYLVGLFVKRATFWWTRLIYQSKTGIDIKVARVT